MKKTQSSPTYPEPKMFSSVREIDQAIRRLQRRLDEVHELATENLPYDDPKFANVAFNIHTAILEIYGPKSPEYLHHHHYRIWSGPEFMGMSEYDLEEGVKQGIQETTVVLQGLIDRLEEKKLDFDLDVDTVSMLPQACNGGAIFVGHGHSPAWMVLAMFIKDKLNLNYVEFNSEPVAGKSTAERLRELLDQSAFAFLIMTAEDDLADGTKRARENVVHEAGLFQGRLGFKRAIIMLEEGCGEFSNIHGLNHILFPKGKIDAAFEAVRDVLKREGIIES